MGQSRGEVSHGATFRTGTGKSFIFYAIILALYPSLMKIILVKLKYLYSQYA